MANQQLSTNTFGTAKWIVSPTLSNGTHTSISSALASASSGDTIFVRPGTYTENITLVAGVNICANDCDAFNNANVTVKGTVTATFTGKVAISGIKFQTNGATAFSATGSNTGILWLTNCDISAQNATGITSSNANFSFYMFQGNVGTAGTQAVFSITGMNLMQFIGTVISSNTTASTISSGTIYFQFCNASLPISLSSSASISVYNSACFGAGNSVFATLSGTSTISIFQSFINSGTASAISVGTGCIAYVYECSVYSSATDAFTGAGTLNYGGVTFQNSSTINVTTQNPVAFSIQEGGTAASSFTAYAPVCGGTTTTGALQSVATGTAGYVLTYNTSSSLPTWQAVPGTEMAWTDEAAPFAAVASNGYFITATCTGTLPASPSQGNTIAFSVDSVSGILTIQANTGQTIRVSTNVSASAGTCASNKNGDSITLVYRSSDTSWIASSVINTWTLT